MWKIPLSNVDIDSEEIQAVSKLLKSKWLTQGPKTAEFEKAFAEFLGVKYAFAVSNGTAALHIAHQVLGTGPGDEVICPSLTFVATANSILYTGANPVFADINGVNDLNISPDEIEKKITPKTKGIAVVHFGGFPCEMDKIAAIAKKHNLYLVEDACHAPGAEYHGKKCGTFGDIGCFSLYSNKNLTTGEGGMIVTDREELADKIKLIRSHGMTSLAWDRHKGSAQTYDVVDLGYNYRFDEIRSALGLVQLSKLKKNNKRRESILIKYQQALGEVKGIILPFIKYQGHSSFHIFPVILEDTLSREDIRNKMNDRGVQTSIHYPAIHLFSYYKKRFGYKGGELPVTEDVCKREMTLPLYPSMSDDDIEYVIDAVRNTCL